jgi:small subunit ribosomal protein S16
LALEIGMAVKLRLKRMGRTNLAFYRLNAMDSRSPRDGRVIEELGYYDPQAKGTQFVAKLDRCKHWLDQGAIPSETVSSLLKKNGLDHKQLRLPKPGKPKVVAAPAAPATAEKKADEQSRTEQPQAEKPKAEEAKAEA